MYKFLSKISELGLGYKILISFLSFLLGGPLLLIIFIVLIIMSEGTMAEEERQRRAQQQQQAIEQRKRKEQEANKERIYQDALSKKRDEIYPNSPVTKEIVKIITQGNELPHSIELENTGLTFCFESATKTYVYRAHGLPDMDKNEEKIFAGVLNQKLYNRYSITENTKCCPFRHSDGTLDSYTIHISTKMLLKTTRSF